MDNYNLDICGLKRELPIVMISPKLKIASFNLLGDGELVERSTEELAKKIEKIDFDYLVGPEVKVVPLIHALSKKVKKMRYIILRKNIMGYMIHPISNKSKPTLVLNGPDAQILKDKKVVVIDDVVSTGRTINVVSELMRTVNAKVVAVAAILKQGEESQNLGVPFFYLGTLPFFPEDKNGT